MRARTILLLATACCAAPAAAPAGAPEVRRDLPYAPGGNARQTLDVYAPPGAHGLPVVFWIHGGGWQSGDKREVDAKPAALAARGYVFVSINYRLLPEVRIGEMARDAARAFRWTRRHVREYGGDPARIVVTGHSAGAQLAALLCTDPRYLEAEGLSLAAVRGCVPVDGDTYDVPMQIATVEDRRADRYRTKFGDLPEQRALSPVTHVRRGRRIPPFLILHVAEHPEVRAQSRRLADELRHAGIPVAVHAAGGTDHVALNAHLGRPGDAPTRVLLEFLEQVLGGPHSPAGS